MVHFKKGEKKEETARLYLEAAAREGQDRVVLIGVAQQKASIVAAEGAEEGPPSPHGWGREMAYINHFSFYGWDSEWGAAFWKTNSYTPWNRSAAAANHSRDGSFREVSGRAISAAAGNRSAGRNRAWPRRGRRSRSASAMAAGGKGDSAGRSPPIASISQNFFDGILSAVPQGSALV